MATVPQYQEDLVATKRLRDLSIKTEPRVYQIVLGYTAKDPNGLGEPSNSYHAPGPLRWSRLSISV